MATESKDLRDLLDKIAIEQGFNSYNLEITPISSGGANFTSLLYLITVSDDKETLELFGKVANISEKTREALPLNIFSTERFFYTELTKRYREIEDRHNIPVEYRINVPKYYGSSSKILKETIVLENLVKNGYKDYNRVISMNWTYASKSVEELAKLHALSYAYAKESPEEFKEVLKIVDMHFDVLGEQQKQMVQKNAELAISVANDEHKEKLQQLVTEMAHNFYEKFLIPINKPLLIHGDYRVSNQMYKTHEDGSVTIKTMDFQTLQNGCPASDLLYLIVTGTDEEFRRQHYQALIDHYYEQLCAALRRLHVEPNDVYTREQYDQELRQKLPYALMIAIFAIPLVTVEAKHAPVVDENTDLTNLKVEIVSDLYPERMRGFLNDFARWGVL